MDVYITLRVIPTSIYEHLYSAHVYVGMSTYIYACTSRGVCSHACALEWCLHACSTNPYFWNEIIGLERSRQGTSKRPPETPGKTNQTLVERRISRRAALVGTTSKKLNPLSLTTSTYRPYTISKLRSLIPLESPHNPAHVAHTD